MKSATVIIPNRLGLHARAAAKLVSTASGFSSQVYLERNGNRINGKSIMGVMMLAASQGTELKLIADGQDESEAIQRLSELIEHRFGEDE